MTLAMLLCAAFAVELGGGFREPLDVISFLCCLLALYHFQRV